MRELWSCPKCGARLVTRNLWHSCGTFSLEALFPASESALDLARAFCGHLEALGDVQVIPQKTRVVAVARVRFAGLVPRKDHFVANFALRRRLDSPRILKIEDYGPAWQAHHVRIRTFDDIDRELLDWLRESHDVAGLQSPRNA